MKPEKSLWIWQKWLQEISTTLFFVFSSLLAAISVDLKVPALTNKQQCSSGQPHSCHRSRSRISQYQNNSRGVGGCFHPAELGAYVFHSQWQDKRPPSWDVQWLFCPDVCPKTFVMGTCSKFNTWRLSAGERILFVWCLWEWDTRSNAGKCETCSGLQTQLLVQLWTFDLSTDKAT